jgi:hypothetical protein
VKQAQIRDLLLQAAADARSHSWEHTIEIHIQFVNALNVTYANLPAVWLEGAQFMLDHIFLDTLYSRPDYLIDLLPAFVVLCGDAGIGSIAPRMDWSMFPTRVPPIAGPEVEKV